MWDNHTPLTSLLISLLWAVSRVSDRVVNEPHCISFLLASLYLLWGWKLRAYKICIINVIKCVYDVRDDTCLGHQRAHRFGMEDLRSVLDGHVVALCLFILLFVFHLEGATIDTQKSSCLSWLKVLQLYCIVKKTWTDLQSWPFLHFS